MDRKVEDDVVSQLVITKKLKQNEDVLCDMMDVGTNVNPTEVLIDSKGKSKLAFMDIFENHSKSTPGSTVSNNITKSHSNLSSRGDDDDDEEEEEEEEEEEDDANSEYYYEDDDADYDYDNNKHIKDDDDYLAIQSQFDNVDLPTGVEVTLPWLKDPTQSKSTSVTPHLSETKKHASILGRDDSGASETKSGVASSSSSTVTAESSSNGDAKECEINDVIAKFRNFKQFDTVEDFSDHHYNKMGFSEQQPPKKWAKRIQEEWKILEKDLPETISVRVYEARMELLRAVIVGPAGTPYHDGLFFFDCLLPPEYPDKPPMVYYYSGGLRLNPNLYDCGKVCLSLLGTWSGNKDEMWIPGKSTMLQVLVSIQALILNADPYFNEPGYEKMRGKAEGEKQSNRYSEDAFIMSLKTMVYTLRRPPKYFEDYVIGHFHTHAHKILVACKAYVDGYKVGSIVVKDGVADLSQGAKDVSVAFTQKLRKMISVVITNFSRFGSIDCEQFRIDDS